MSSVNLNALESSVRKATINQKANACPMMVRLAWHAAGTFDKSNGTGGTDGATMRFEPESTDDANAGLSIVRDLLKPVAKAHPEVSVADIWCFSGAKAVEFSGGPKVPVFLGRTDEPANTSSIPENGRLPDAAQGAQHLRDVFYRQGFNDQEIVALSGAHTLGRCHMVRSGFDGPWTSNPLKFDNEYFTNLLNKKWNKRAWDGPEQYQDEETGELMMLPTDIALINDDSFRPHVERYAADSQVFFDEFAAAFAKLIANGSESKATEVAGGHGGNSDDSEKFMENAMHGSLEMVQKYSKTADVHCIEANSGRTALHKAAFWGHAHIIPFLVGDCKINVNVLDANGDNALNDAVRFGHAEVVKQLLAAGSDGTLANKEGQDAQGVAAEYAQDAVAALLTQHGLKTTPANALSPELTGKVIESLLDQLDRLQAK